MLKNLGDQVTPEQPSMMESDEDIMAEESPLHKGKIPEATTQTPKSISTETDAQLPDSIESTPKEKTLESLRTVTRAVANIQDYEVVKESSENPLSGQSFDASIDSMLKSE